MFQSDARFVALLAGLMITAAHLAAEAGPDYYLKLPDIDGESDTAPLLNLHVEPAAPARGRGFPPSGAIEPAAPAARQAPPAPPPPPPPPGRGSANTTYPHIEISASLSLDDALAAGSGQWLELVLEPGPVADALCTADKPVSAQVRSQRIMIVLTDGEVRSCETQRTVRAAHPGERCPRTGCFTDLVTVRLTGTIQDEARGLTAIIR
jgi:hypothetical protein